MGIAVGLKGLACAAGLLVLVAALVPVAVTWIERRQAQDLEGREPHVAAAGGSGRTAIVYFSRSGNTALAARYLANRLDASLFELEAPDYRLGLTGWASAMQDARGEQADIAPRRIDLSGYDTVYLGSPIWLYAPAPPIRAFVEHNRFDGQRVVLFNTYNSEFKPGLIDLFESRVMARGAASFEHRAVRRGRMTQQIGPDEMLRAIDAEWFIVEAPPVPAVDTTPPR